MDYRYGAPAAGMNFPNSVPPAFYEQNLSFGSTDSTDSNESIRTQVPLPYHLSQNNAYNNMGYVQNNAHARSTGSNSNRSSSLNPNSSVYIPQGNTPILSSPDMSLSHGWGAPYSNGPILAQQQLHGMNAPQMQYQTQSQYQQSQIASPVNGMVSQGQFGNNSGPCSHLSAPGVARAQDFNQYGNVNVQMPYQASDASYANMAPQPQADGPQYTMNAQAMHQMYGFQNGNSSSSTSQSQYSGQRQGSSSFDSASTTHTNNTKQSNQTADSSFMLGNQQQSRPSSTHSQASSNRDKQKSYEPKDRNNFGRGSQSNSSTPGLIGGPVNPPHGVRNQGPEKIISQHRKSKSVAITDTSFDSTPLAKSHPSDDNRGNSTSETPQLRSRRGQTITSTNDTVRKSVSNWAARLPNTVEPAVQTFEDMKRRGSPVKAVPNALAIMKVHSPDPFTSSPGSLSAKPFDCMIGGSFIGNFSVGGPFSNDLMRLTNGGRNNPPLSEALAPNNVPFTEYCRSASPDTWGVVKIKSIPYGVNRAEVLAFLGRNARIINESEAEPIHIVMERVTSKTLDCFVEFVNLGEAVAAVNRFETNRMGGRGGRLGQRHVEVELSTQGALLKELFPKAKNVRWESGRPQIIDRDPNDPYNSGFQGFVTKEELIMMRKHVETPQRSPFSKDCPQRPYECLISTLVKYPWYMIDHITIEDRNMLHETTIALLDLLVDRINSNDDQNVNVNMNQMLLKRVWRAALQCPGLTPSMKDDIVYIASLSPQTAIENGLAPHASHWHKLWCIGPRPNVPVDVLLWYIGKIRQASAPVVTLSLAEQAEKGVESREEMLFGDLDKHINYGPDFKNMSLGQVAKLEWAAIETALRRAFTQALPAPY